MYSLHTPCPPALLSVTVIIAVCIIKTHFQHILSTYTINTSPPPLPSHVMSYSIMSHHDNISGHQLQGDRSVQQRLSAKLASDEIQMKQLLETINVYDLRLWKHAQNLVQTRWKHFQQQSTSSLSSSSSSSSSSSLSSSNHHNNDIKTSLLFPSKSTPDRTQSSLQCDMVTLSPTLNKDVGLFRPPGHKGPLDIQL